ncbi:hypothetical protein FRC12_015167 [Ceratobasidium sp. 428]|nr:hypothetical protein FRC12_015167 [Ceratobasidium sp. 428]
MDMRSARTSFAGEYLVSTLQNVRNPPRTDAKGSRAQGAKEVIDKYTLALTGLRLREEMRAFERNYEGIEPESLSDKDVLEALNFDGIEALVHTWCPMLFALIYMLSTCVCRGRHWRSNGGNANFFVVMFICCMAYQLSNRNNALQRLLGYYFKAKHVPKAVIDMLANLNICMSYPSITATLSSLSESVREAALAAIQKMPFLIAHDNIRIKQGVRSQRHDNQTITDNGTAMTVFILPESSRPAWEDPEAVRALQSHVERMRALGTPLRITFNHLVCPLREARIMSHKLYHLLDILRAVHEYH